MQRKHKLTNRNSNNHNNNNNKITIKEHFDFFY